MKRDMKPHALLLIDQIPPARRVTGTVDALIVQESIALIYLRFGVK